MRANFKRMTIDEKKGITLEIALSSTTIIDSKHIVSLERPKADEEKIRSSVKQTMMREYEEGFFREHVQKELEEQVRKHVAAREREIKTMPQPVIFTGSTYETKYGSGVLIIKFFVNVETAEYFLKNHTKIEGMIVKVDFFPNSIDADIIAKDITDTVDIFLQEKEDAIKIDSCFHGFYELIKGKKISIQST